MNEVEFGIIGGSGLYAIDGLKPLKEFSLQTPFGNPSDALKICEYNGKRVAFLARHGRNHNISPPLINYRANIYAMKILGVKQILSISAVGSLREDFAPLHIVIPDQYYDATTSRKRSFFDDGIVAHVSMAEPVCPLLHKRLTQSSKESGAFVHEKGTYICIEGPQFSTQAESEFYRKSGFDIIGMTSMPEAKLAREAEICYTTLALVTDYDCWHPQEENVSVDGILEILNKNAKMASSIVANFLNNQTTGQCSCQNSLKSAILTKKENWKEESFHKLRPIIGRYG